jgi:hypothetical protein
LKLRLLANGSLEYPGQLAGHRRNQIREYVGKLIAAFPLVKVELISRVNLGVRQKTWEHG